MAGTRTKRPAAPKKTTRKRRRPAARKKKVSINYSRIALALGLLLLLAVSMGALGYVVFFRTVVV